MFDAHTVDELETALVARERVIGKLRAEQLALLRHLDTAQITCIDGTRTLAEWVAGRLDIDSRDAQDLVRLARARNDSHEAAMADGEISFSRAVATHALEAAGAQPATVQASLGWNLSRVRQATSRHRERSIHDEIAAHEARHVIIQPSLDESVWRFRGLLPGQDGLIVSKALLEEADSFPVDPDLPRESRAARTADALTSLCVRSLDVHTTTEIGNTRSIVSLHVDAHRLAETKGRAGIQVESGPAVGLTVLEQALCEGSVELTATTLQGQPLAVGRTTRVISPRLRRHILNRDGGCTAAGCTSSTRLQPHHIIPWSDGGRTDPDNLTTLCWYHHHVIIHGRGYHIDPTSPPHQRRFTRQNRRGPP